MSGSSIDQYATAGQHAEIRTWFETWGRCVAGVDYASARELFHPDVVGFGTYTAYVRGLDELERQQWRSVWPTITDFRFLVDRLICSVSPDGTMAQGIVPWLSTGYHEDGSSFERPGRATVLLVRDSERDPWRGIHTHFSLAPGTPQRSYGDRRAGS